MSNMTTIEPKWEAQYWPFPRVMMMLLSQLMLLPNPSALLTNVILNYNLKAYQYPWEVMNLSELHLSENKPPK